MGDKYKVIVKVVEVSGLSKTLASVKVRGTCEKKPKESSKTSANNAYAQWESDNVICKLSLKSRDKEPLEIALLDVPLRRSSALPSPVLALP